MSPTRSATLTIDSIAAGGDGVGRLDGMVAFVPRTAPGDRIEAMLSIKSGFARGEIQTVIEPAAVRVEPACVHYTRDKCGGCQLQHMTYAAQVEAKATIIRDALTRIGRRMVERPIVHASPAEWRYRSKLTLALRRQGGRWWAGLHPYDDSVAVFPLEDCPITDTRVVTAWKEIMRAADLLPRSSSLRGAVRLIHPEEGDGQSATMSAVFEGGDSWANSGQFFARTRSLSTLWWIPEDRPRKLEGRREGHQGASASFAQVNPAVATQLREHVVASALSYSPKTLMDAYAGVGDTAEALANTGIRVTAIELDAEAGARCRERLAPPSSVIIGKVEDHIESALPADVVIVNPPRTGLHEAVTAVLDAERGSVRAIIYVSCNPATLGRDVARLPGFRIASVEGFDMFPQTAHVETVCVLVPDRGGTPA